MDAGYIFPIVPELNGKIIMMTDSNILSFEWCLFDGCHRITCNVLDFLVGNIHFQWSFPMLYICKVCASVILSNINFAQ